MNNNTPRPEDALEVLLERQRLLGTDVIDNPISMLQRRFRLGYTPTVALLCQLEVQGFIQRISDTAIQLAPWRDGR